MFPLPLIDVPLRTHGGEGHKLQRRLRLERQLTNPAIDVVNWLPEGSSSEPRLQPCDVDLEGLQREVQNFVGSQCRHHVSELQQHASTLVYGDAALNALLRGRDL